MERTAKLFRNGSSQAVRLPKEFRVRGREVIVKRFGDMVVLVPKVYRKHFSRVPGLVVEDWIRRPGLAARMKNK
jgi:virulence-associated protein VagC